MRPVIIGAGLAGLTTALSLAPMPVTLICAQKFGCNDGHAPNSMMSQGGIAAALDPDDNAELHVQDTIKAGAGLCDADIVRQVCSGGATVIEKLIERGVRFDHDANGQILLGLEGAHGKRRIVHAGDATGAEIMRALTLAVRNAPHIEIRDETRVLDIATHDGHVVGVTVVHNGINEFMPSDQVVLATGGVGALWQHTTNPLGAQGQGLALAARAGAVLGDLEFMQFHPTAIVAKCDPMPLASEALRGEGAVLVDETGHAFTDSLQPRDIVARAIWQHRALGHKTFLDVRPVADFAKRFPHIYGVCVGAGLDTARQNIEIHPAAHYHMGGVVVDACGRTSVHGLWSCGEVANTGLHGANRLASNSLLEAAYFGAVVAQDISGVGGQGSVVGGLHSVFDIRCSDAQFDVVRSIMSQHVGVMRHDTGLTQAVAQLAPIALQSDAALVGLMIAQSALQRCESIGAHARTDYPNKAAQSRRSQMSLNDLKPLLKNARAA